MKTELKKSQEDMKTELKNSQEDTDTESKTVKIEEMLKQLLDMMRDFVTELKNSREESKTELNSQETMKNSQEIKKTELKTEVEKKVRVIEEVTTSIEETATSPKSEVKEGVHRIESEDENKCEELKMKHEGADSAKANGTTDSNEDVITDNAELKPEFNDNAKEGESSGSVAASGSNDLPENEEKTINLQVAWEVLELDKKIYQKRGEEGGNFEFATNDIKEGLRMRDEFPVSTVEEQQGQDLTKRLQRSREGLDATVTRLSDGVWRIPKCPRVKMRFVRLKLFEGSTDGVT